MKIKESKDHAIGHFKEAPHYIQDNEFLLHGYRLNFFTMRKIFRSLFMCHNESVNIWTHLLISLFCFYLIFQTEFYFDNSLNFLNLEQTWHLNKINVSTIIHENLPYLYNERLLFNNYRIIYESMIKNLENSKEINTITIKEMKEKLENKIDLGFLDRNIGLLK